MTISRKLEDQVEDLVSVGIPRDVVLREIRAGRPDVFVELANGERITIQEARLRKAREEEEKKGK